MYFISTQDQAKPVPFLDAMSRGLAPDGGLYVPKAIPKLKENFWESLTGLSLQEIGCEIAKPFLSDELNEPSLLEIIEEALNFEVPLVPLSDNLYILELFHGPTLAFKDFGARFMARMFQQQVQKRDQEIVILVATSGDTGSAVAHGFLNVQGINVCLLYPDGKVSRLQEKQMATLGHNIQALKVEGTFDDCQRLVKQAFADPELSEKLCLSSANSINIARLLPQSFYYAYGLAQLQKQTDIIPFFSVPSGNFGNLTAGLWAMKMGMPVSRFLAATNRNDVVTKYLQGGPYRPQPSFSTISNAMDVGNPSNFARIQHLFNHSDEAVRKSIWGQSFTDDETRRCIRRVFNETGYILDPHTAVGVLAAEAYKKESKQSRPAIILSTAHPAKFREVVEPLIDQPMPIPNRLERCLDKEILSLPMESNDFALKDFLLGNYG
jgi:threonine synthase